MSGEKLAGQREGDTFRLASQRYAREDSDWDILIILDKEKLITADYDNITYPLTELGWELGEEINPVMYTTQEWEKYKNTPFVRNVEKEGVRI